MPGIDPRGEIERLEAQIEQLTDRLESCRKFILAARVAVAAGGIVLVAILFGALRFDPMWLSLAVAALLGGVVAWGANRSTANEAADALAAAETHRAELIGLLHLKPVGQEPTLH